MAYTGIDHFIARVRFRAAYPHVREHSRLCDLGCGLETAFLDFAEDKISYGVGVDDQVENGTRGRWTRVHADIRATLPLDSSQFDHVTMLAVSASLFSEKGSAIPLRKGRLPVEPVTVASSPVELVGPLLLLLLSSVLV